LTWSQVIRRDSGEAQLSICRQGSKERVVLIPAAIAGPLLASRAKRRRRRPCSPSVRNPGDALIERVLNSIVKDAAERAGASPAASIHWLRHAHASLAIDNEAPIMLVSATLGHADLKTTGVHAHARPLSEVQTLTQGNAMAE
jgi:integrase/recombinase XerD